MSGARMPVRVYCKNCGAPSGFDILRQTYRCAYCQTETGITEVKRRSPGWRPLDTGAAAVKVRGMAYSCPTCGGSMLIAEGEGTGKCDFCGTKLVRAQLAEEQLPEIIIPFFITRDEAKERLLEWTRKNRRRPEAKLIAENIDKLEGKYLFFYITRGPVSGEVERDKANRKYHCKGFIEGSAVNVNMGCDNAVLQAAEPFDWTGARQFEYGYLAGQNVRLADISGADAQLRVLSEVEEEFLPEVCRVMGTQATEVRVSAEQLEMIPALLPFYTLRCGKLFAAVNGQTGRIAVSQKKTKKKRTAWFIEPIVYTLACTAAVAPLMEFNIFMILLALMIFFGTFFGLMYHKHLTPVREVILRTKAARAKREGERLELEEGKNILKNPFDNSPVFFENDRSGRSVPVEIRFYTPLRWLYIFVKLIILNFLPAILAAVIRLIQTGGSVEHFFDKYFVMGGGSWYFLAAFITIMYWTFGVRRDVYDHPLLYELLPDGRKRRLRGVCSYRLSLFSMLGDGFDKNGNPIPFKERIKDGGCIMLGIAAGVLVFLFFNTAAILY